MSTSNNQKTHQLIVPVTFEGQQHTSITIRRVKAKDLRNFNPKEDSLSDVLDLIARLSGWPRKDTYPWVEQTRLGRKPAMQIPADEATEMTLEGMIFPDWRGGLAQIDHMRAAASRKQPLMLVSGMGRIFGFYVIMSIEEKASIFKRSGAPRKQEFTLTLKEYGSDGGWWHG